MQGRGYYNFLLILVIIFNKPFHLNCIELEKKYKP